jgi:hypothetical protein
VAAAMIGPMVVPQGQSLRTWERNGKNEITIKNADQIQKQMHE